MRSWLNQRYDFFGRCDVVLLSHPNYAPGKSIRIHTRTESTNYTFSWNTAVAVQIGTDIFEINTGDWKTTKFFFNKQPVTFAQIPTMIGGYKVTTDIKQDRFRNWNNAAVFINLEDGDILQLNSWDRYSDICIPRFTDRFRDSVGMLGNWTTGKMPMRDGSLFATPPPSLPGNPWSATTMMPFGQEWQVRPTEPSLFASNRDPQFPAQCTAPAPGGKAWIGQSSASSICSRLNITAANALADCAYDVYLTGDPDVAKKYTVTRTSVPI
jgi:hypothetical protein